MTRSPIGVLVLLALVLGLAGCGGGGGGVAADVDAALAGLWQIIGATEDGAFCTLANALDWNAGWTSSTLQLLGGGGAFLRSYQDDILVDTDDGAWTADAATGTGTLTLEGVETPFTYVLDGNVVAISLTQDGHDYVLTWMKVVTLTERDPALIKTWRADSATLDDVPVAPEDLWEFEPGATGAAAQFLASGAVTFRSLKDSEVLSVESVFWRTGGGAFRVWMATEELRGIYELGSLTTTAVGPDGEVGVTRWVEWAPGGGGDEGFVGTWRAQSATQDGAEFALAEFFGWVPGATQMNVQFWADGTAESIEYAGVAIAYRELGAWSAAGGALQLTFDEGQAMTYAFAGNVVTLSFSEGGHDYVVTFTKVA